jgi:hypothetical protein
MDSRNYICGGTKFIYSKGYIGLPVTVERLPETVSVEGQELLCKSTFHVSLLCVKELLLRKPDFEEAVLDFFCAFSKANDISFVAFSGEFRFAQDGDRKTLVALCKVSNLEKFFVELSAHLGVEVPPQPTHVTLYTLQPELGIGLNSKADMASKSVPVEAPSAVTVALTI